MSQKKIKMTTGQRFGQNQFRQTDQPTAPNLGDINLAVIALAVGLPSPAKQINALDIEALSASAIYNSFGLLIGYGNERINPSLATPKTRTIGMLITSDLYLDLDEIQPITIINCIMKQMIAQYWRVFI